MSWYTGPLHEWTSLQRVHPRVGVQIYNAPFEENLQFRNTPERNPYT